MQQHSVNWVEIPVADFDRAKKFYSAIYDFEMPEMMMGPNRMGFLLFDQQGGGIGAAIVKGESYVTSKDGMKVYLNAGQDLNNMLSRVDEAGGKVIMEKFLIAPELGYVGGFEDTEGNVLWLHSKK